MNKDEAAKRIAEIKKKYGIEQTFNESVNPQTLLDLLKPSVIQTLREQIWVISEKDLDFSWETILSYIKKSCVLVIMFTSLDNPAIIRNLDKPVFKCLRELQLQSNNITSIENLPFLHTENIVKLGLAKNLIANFKPLSKTKWNSLISLNIDNNPSFELELNRLKVHRQFDTIRVDPYFQGTDKFINDFRELIKLQASEMGILSVRKKGRISQDRIFVPLYKKYPKMTIYLCRS